MFSFCATESKAVGPRESFLQFHNLGGPAGYAQKGVVLAGILNGSSNVSGCYTIIIDNGSALVESFRYVVGEFEAVDCVHEL